MSNEEKQFEVSSITLNGPEKKIMNSFETINYLNMEKSNNKTIFINGNPITDDIINEEHLPKGKKYSITVLNELVGG